MLFARCHSFIDVGRAHETPGLGTKGFIIKALAITAVSTFVPFSPTANSTAACMTTKGL